MCCVFKVYKFSYHFQCNFFFCLWFSSFFLFRFFLFSSLSDIYYFYIIIRLFCYIHIIFFPPPRTHTHPTASHLHKSERKSTVVCLCSRWSCVFTMYFVFVHMCLHSKHDYVSSFVIFLFYVSFISVVFYC